MVEQTRNSSQMTPVQLLEAQLRYLDEIHKAQLREKIALREQTEKLAQFIARVNDITHVKIEDVNMPFVALVGILVKVAVAGIPAALIIGFVYLFATAFIGGLLSVLF